jgi:replicative DNA helicase
MQTAQANKDNKVIQLHIASLKTKGVPESEQAEQALIAAVLYLPNAFHEIATRLDDNAWFWRRHTIIWNAMNELTNDGVAIDNVTISERLLETKSETNESALHDIGGPAYLTQLLSDNFSSYKNYRDYVDIINTAYRRRCMLKAADDLRTAATDYDSEINISVNNAYSILDNLSDKNRTFTTIGDGLKAHMDTAEHALNNPIKMGIPSGIKSLDEKIDGFHKRRVYLIGARTHHGKTALLMTTALHAASQGARVGIFNVADGNKQDVISRLIGMAANINTHKVLMGRCKPEEYSRYVEATRRVSQYPIYIESQMGMTLPELLVKARNMKHRYGLDLVCIDYAQEIGVDTGNPKAPQHRVDQLRYIASTITKLAGEDFLDVPIMLAAQLNRGADGRAPVSADIKGSGAFEQTADVIILGYREKLTDTNIELHVTKNRVTSDMGIVEAQINSVSSKIENAKW